MRIPALLLAATLAACGSLVPSQDARKELLPAGKLRVGIGVGAAPSAFWAVRDPVSGLPRGASIDLAYALGRRLEAPLELVAYTSPGEIAAAAAKGEWDVAFLPADAGHRPFVDFGPSYGDAAVAVPKGRPAALAYVTRFIDAAKGDGTVRRALDNAGLKNVPVEPAQ
jgi:polar amino acid transport system substrate-binding protein